MPLVFPAELWPCKGHVSRSKRGAGLGDYKRGSVADSPLIMYVDCSFDQQVKSGCGVGGGRSGVADSPYIMHVPCPRVLMMGEPEGPSFPRDKRRVWQS